MSEVEKLKAQITAIYEGLSNLVSRLNEIEESWAQAPPQVKAEGEVDPEEIEGAIWTPYNSGKGEWVFSDKLPKLKVALEKAGKRLEHGDYIYRLQGTEDKCIARYPKSKK